MNVLPNELLIKRAEFLNHVRTFFIQTDYLQVDTPVMTAHSGTDAYLDPFRMSEKYLITSPELSLKKIWSKCGNDKRLGKIFEIAHSFRQGDNATALHSPEFLMLEWYNIDSSLDDLMVEVLELLEYLDSKMKLDHFSIQENQSKNYQPKIISIKDYFQEKLNCSFERSELENYLQKNHAEMYSENLNFSDLFFSIFLNTIEPELKKYKEPIIVKDYPSELAALSETVSDIALRFELYWKGVEIANAYLELSKPVKLQKRFSEDSKVREKMGKEKIEADSDFLEAMSILDKVREKNKACGIALGLDRLFMLLMGKTAIQEVSPYKF